MKKNLLAFAFLCFVVTAFAQDNTEPGFKLPRNILKISPLQFAVNTMELSIETFNKTYSRSFNASVAYRSSAIQYSDGSGGGLELAFRKYAAPMKYRERGNRQAYQGIYYSFFVRGDYFKGENNDYEITWTTFTEQTVSVTPGFTIGFQRTLWQIIILDAYIGGGVKFTEVDHPDTGPPADYEPYYEIFDPGYSGIFPKIGFKIGIGL